MLIEQKLAKLEKKSLENGHFALAAAASHVLAAVGDLDRQINLVGALHEVGSLRNVIAPYWKVFRIDEARWMERCLARLISADHDYWALAGLLGCQGPAVVASALEQGFQSAAVRCYDRYDKPRAQVETLFLKAQGSTLSPVLEIGYDSASLEVIDVARARALALDAGCWAPGTSLGNGWLYYSMQAKLPYGSWRTPSTRFEMKEASQISG